MKLPSYQKTQNIMTDKSVKNDIPTPTIIACIDTTNASESALIYACQVAKSKNFAVEIIAVIEPSHKNLLFGAKAMGNQKRESLEEHLNRLIGVAHKETGIMPSMSIHEGDIVSEITRKIKKTPHCALLIFGKSHNALSDNVVLPKIVQKIGYKINIPVTIVPGNLSHSFLEKLV